MASGTTLANIDSKSAAESSPVEQLANDCGVKLDDAPTDKDAKNAKSEWPANRIEDQVCTGNGKTAPVYPLDSMEVDSDNTLSTNRHSLDSGSEKMDIEECDHREFKRQRGSSGNDSRIDNAPDPVLDVIYMTLSRVFCVDFKKEFDPVQKGLNAHYLSSSGEGQEFCPNNLIHLALADVMGSFFSVSGIKESLAVYNNMTPKEPSNSTDASKHSLLKDLFKNAEISTYPLLYIVEAYERIEQELKDVNMKPFAAQMKETLTEARLICVNYAALVLTNGFSPLSVDVNPTSSLLTYFVLHQWPRGFLIELIVSTYNEYGIDGLFRSIFEPLLQSLWQEMLGVCSFGDEKYKLPLQGLTELCDVQVGSNNRPICQLVSLEKLSIASRF